MTDHDDRWYLRDGEVMRQAADGSIHRYRDALDADDHASVRRLIEDRDALTAMLDDVRESLADHYAAGVRGPLVDDLIACLGHPGDPSGVPGGGEPQPTTSTDEIARLRAVVDAVRQWGPHTPRRVARALAALDEPVRSAGGGDQPDTPCDLCDSTGELLVFPFDGKRAPCPACTDKETPHGH